MDLQRILWRDSPSKPVKEFKLRTVTYGTACAPYLACKTLQQLAEDYRYKYPKASQTLRENFYVDDALFGAFDMPTALKVREELRQLLQLGHFNLRKWISNSADLLEGISENDRELNQSVQVLSDPQIKALGINWNSEADQFCFHVDLPQSDTITKRTVLSDISRLYDPLGWLSPVIISAKIFLQRLWLEKIDWDETLPDELSQRWFTLKQSLTLLNDIRLDRWLGTSCQSHQGWELQGYCDASLAAYGAVIYLRVPSKDQMKISLLAAKTRVSPIATVSLPRLELCGAALLAELARYLQQALQLTDVPLYLWTDSLVVLAWLREHPSKWNVFVANRVSQIHQLAPQATWLHIASSENPADCISRGLTAEQLKDFDLWWLGPSSLREPSSTWSRGPIPPTDQELRPSQMFVTQKPQPHFSELLHRYSSLSKLLRISALSLRFFTNLSRARGERIIGCLTMEELNNALITWIRLIQRQSFPEFDAIVKDQPLPSSSRLLRLRPFLDQQGILRVGGRLKESLLCYDEKHPIILPKGHLTYLIILHAHTSTLHGSVQHTLHHIRAKYWILSGRNEVRKIVRRCVTCCRHGAKTATQVMGDLPPSKPFSAAGVDYAGPFFVTPVRRRVCKATKAYVAVFVCFVTRAIHLELVMDLTAEAFIAAFKRFVSRRGRCERLYSDNATYFTAANKRLVLDYKQLKKESSHAILDMGTDWHFMPPAAPHFGGIWESGVRCFKYHLRRVVNDYSLPVEEMLTLIAQIKCCLNSRPLYSLSDDPADLSALTPGHFLVGGVLNSVPAPSLLQTPIQRLNRWDFVQRMYEDLWKRWYKDYIHHLQVRNKWTQSQRSMEVNDLVLIKDERLPPSKWLMGRVIDVQPGDDGYVRVARVRHKDGSYKRPITKLCLLPLQAPAEA